MDNSLKWVLNNVLEPFLIRHPVLALVIWFFVSAVLSVSPNIQEGPLTVSKYLLSTHPHVVVLPLDTYLAGYETDGSRPATAIRSKTWPPEISFDSDSLESDVLEPPGAMFLVFTESAYQVEIWGACTENELIYKPFVEDRLHYGFEPMARDFKKDTAKIRANFERIMPLVSNTAGSSEITLRREGVHILQARTSAGRCFITRETEYDPETREDRDVTLKWKRDEADEIAFRFFLLFVPLLFVPVVGALRWTQKNAADDKAPSRPAVEG